MKRDLKRLSRFMSLVLRHRPDQFGLTLDPAGWVGVAELVAAARRAGVPLSREHLRAVVVQNDKQRFSLSPDGQRIRANQGHSVPVDLGLATLTPPLVLFHGTAKRFLPSIRTQGLLRRTRLHVHLSAEEKTALAVGKRHGRPVVLSVKAADMREEGFSFYRSENGVWLTAHVPVAYLVFPDV